MMQSRALGKSVDLTRPLTFGIRPSFHPFDPVASVALLLNVSLPACLSQLLALLCLGEIGRRTDLSKHKGLEVTVTEAFHAPSEELKAAAAYALGSIAVGNLDKYLPYLLEQITSQPKLQYFLLSSLKEVSKNASVEVSADDWHHAQT
jgi:hypothetical protein